MLYFDFSDVASPDEPSTEVATSTDAILVNIDKTLTATYELISFFFLMFMILSCHKILHYRLKKHTEE